MNLKQKVNDLYNKSKKGVVILELALSFGSEAYLATNAEYLADQIQQYVNKHDQSKKFFNDMDTYFKNDGLNWGAIK